MPEPKNVNKAAQRSNEANLNEFENQEESEEEEVEILDEAEYAMKKKQALPLVDLEFAQDWFKVTIFRFKNNLKKLIRALLSLMKDFCYSWMTKIGTACVSTRD